MKDPENAHQLWQQALAGVVKRGETKPNQPKTPKLPTPTGIALPPAKGAATGLVKTRHSQAPLPILSNTAQRLAGCAAGVPAKTFKQLAAGELRPQGVIDLHGLREGDAWLELHAFLSEAQGAEVLGQAVRVVLVIHGKGRGHGTAHDMGVIKAQIAGQLAQHPAVLAFHTALPRDGGMGACYVLVRQ